MKKEYVYGAILFLVGGAIGFEICNYRFRNVYEKRLNDQVAEINAYWNKKYEEDHRVVAKDVPNTATVTTKNTGNDMSQYVSHDNVKPPKTDNNTFVKPAKVDYTKYAPKSSLVVDQPPRPEPVKEKEPVEITVEDYGDDNYEGYEEHYLNFYTGNGVLVDDYDNPITKSDAIDMTGSILSDREADESGRFVYIRNDRLKTFYEVELINGDYEEEV